MKRNCHIWIPHYMFCMIEYNLSTHSIIYQRFVYIIYTLWPKTVQNCQNRNFVTSKLRQNQFFRKKNCQKFRKKYSSGTGYMILFTFFNLPGLKLQKLLIFTILLYSLYKIPTICQISIFPFTGHVPPPFVKNLNGLSCTSGCPLAC